MYVIVCTFNKLFFFHNLYNILKVITLVYACNIIMIQLLIVGNESTICLLLRFMKIKNKNKIPPPAPSSGPQCNEKLIIYFVWPYVTYRVKFASTSAAV